MSLTVLPYGPSALLVETSEVHPASLAQDLRELPGVIDAVPGAATVLVTFEAGDHSEHEALEFYTEQIRALRPKPKTSDGAAAASVTIPVRYDGQDLAEVARASGMSTDDVIELHTGGTYRVAFMGFAPGFGYLEGLDERLHLPRRSTPRTVVPAGAVAIAGTYAAVYPRPSPGGWMLLGTTDLTFFDTTSQPPALLRPGMAVRFEAR